jgi:hypothetical protein
MSFQVALPVSVHSRVVKFAALLDLNMLLKIIGSAFVAPVSEALVESCFPDVPQMLVKHSMDKHLKPMIEALKQLTTQD